jgi:hypothetical protein
VANGNNDCKCFQSEFSRKLSSFEISSSVLPIVSGTRLVNDRAKPTVDRIEHSRKVDAPPNCARENDINEDPSVAPSFPEAADKPWHVARISALYTSLGT